MNGIGIVVLFVVIVTVVCAPRRWAVVGAMAGVLFLTQGQSLNVLGLNLYAVRFVELAGFARVLIRGEVTFSNLTAIDRALLLTYGYSTAVFLLRSSEGAVFQIGVMIDAYLCYFTFRGLIGDLEDFRWFLRAFLLLLGPFAALVLFESLTTNNLFSYMGAVRAEDFMRAGRLRCQGSFRQPILMGTLGASFFPLYISLALSKESRKLGLFGMGLCTIIVWASNSGGPASCAAIGLAGWMLWKWRTRMRFVRRVIAAGIIALTLVMKAPVWYLLARVSLLTGGGGWHRSFLIDNAVQHLSEWWLAGMPIEETIDWFPYSLRVTGGADMTNAFIAFGITSGLIAIGLFVALLTCAYRQLGIALAAVRFSSGDSRTTEFTLWGLGVMLTVHVVNWFGITYFDQIYVVWFLQLAAIANLCTNSMETLVEAKNEEAYNGSDADTGSRIDSSVFDNPLAKQR